MTVMLNNCHKLATINDRNRLFSVIYLIKNKLTASAFKLSENNIESDRVGVENEQYNEIVRDKSRLRPEHRNILFNKKPYAEPMNKLHLSIKYNRKLYGKFGSESGVNPGIMWPTKADIEARKEYEQVAYPHTIKEMIAMAEKELEIKENEKKKLHDKVIDNLSKLDSWKKALQDKIAKKEAEALAVKEKKDKLVEEVRRHFGFTVDPRDERFKEMLTQKEKEQRKKEKQARMEEREKKAIAKLMAKHTTESNE